MLDKLKDFRETLSRLRANFEALALKSTGLFHVFTETTRNGSSDNDSGLPPGTSFSAPRDKWSVVSSQTMPAEWPWPRALTDEEKIAVPTTDEGEKHYIRDRRGRPLAIWMQQVIRISYLCGDFEVIQPFKTLSEAAAQALISAPTELIRELPDDIQSLFRLSGGRSQRYIFGRVPETKLPWLANGWIASAAVYDEGVVVDNPEPGYSKDDLQPVWLLILHRMGWRLEFSPLKASRWYWHGNVSQSYGNPISLQYSDQLTANIPRNRFYSVIGASQSSAVDVCYASSYAISALLKVSSRVEQSADTASGQPISNYFGPVINQTVSTSTANLNANSGVQQISGGAQSIRTVEGHSRRMDSAKLIVAICSVLVGIMSLVAAYLKFKR